MPPVFRFAPSPNGHLHLGHALSALINFDMAQAAGGRLLLRIEDIDAARCRPEYEAAIYEDLAWLGLVGSGRCGGSPSISTTTARRLPSSTPWGSSIRASRAAPRSPGWWPSATPGAPGRAIPTVRRFILERQRPSPAERERRMASRTVCAAARYAGGAARAGALTWNETGEGPAGETGTIAAVPAANPAHWGDVILARKDTPTSYHLAVVVDDAAQGITDVVRGHDLFHSTSVHRLLQALLGLPEPRYRHHRLIHDAEGKKLSKSTAATGLREFRAQGASPADIRRRVGLD